MPKFAIGIICNYNSKTCHNELTLLNSTYKNEHSSYLKHITDIINKNNLNVVIAVIKDSKISEYELSKEDWIIKNFYSRVDINFMNNQIGLKKSKEELDEIKNLFKDKYKSLTFIRSIRMDDHQKEIDKKEKEINEKNKEIDVKNKEIYVKNKEIEEYKGIIQKQENQLSSKDDEIKRLNELLEKYKNAK